MDFQVAIPSYKRAGKVRTLKISPFAKLWVPESQGDDYRAEYGEDRVVTIPDDRDGNVARKRNAISDLIDSDRYVMMDDDITSISYWEAGRKTKIHGDDLKEFIKSGFELADELGVKLWGLNQQSDIIVYHTYAPFSLLSPILGPFTGQIRSKIRYDEEVAPREDYDFWLQHIHTFRKTLRFNKFHYAHDHGKLAGGVVSARTADRQAKTFDRMEKKWGSSVLKLGGSAGPSGRSGQNMLNMKVNIPIPGC